MTFSLGRVGLPTASGGDGLTMAEPLEWEQSGDVIQLRGIQSGLSETNLLWWRDQMMGLRDEIGEDAIPVRSTVSRGSTATTGWSMSASTTPREASTAARSTRRGPSRCNACSSGSSHDTSSPPCSGC